MKVDIKAVTKLFDELLTLSDQEKGIYWFKSTRSDGISITLVLSLYYNHVGIILEAYPEHLNLKIDLDNCLEVYIKDHERNCLEILSANNKKNCLLSIFGDSIINYSN